MHLSCSASNSRSTGQCLSFSSPSCFRGVGGRGRHVALKVHLEPVVQRAVEVDREAADAHHGSVDAHELVSGHIGSGFVFFGSPEPAPRRPSLGRTRCTTNAAVVLHAHLRKLLVRSFRSRFPSRTRRVRVRADDHEPRPGGCVFYRPRTRTPRTCSGEEILAARSQRVSPRVALGDLLSSSSSWRRFWDRGDERLSGRQWYLTRASSNVARRRCSHGAGARVRLPENQKLARHPRERGRPPDAKKSRSGTRDTGKRGARSRTRLEPRSHESFARGEHGVVRRPRLVEVRHEIHRLGRRALGVAIGDGKARAPDVSSDFFRFGR